MAEFGLCRTLSRSLTGRYAVAVITAAVLAGCASETPRLDASTSIATGSAASDPLVATPSKAAFNPFADQGTVPIGGRVVIQNPSVAEVMKVGPLEEMALGRETAPVTIIKYASLTCPYCRQFQAETFPVLKREYIDTGKVRFIIREFPIGFTSGAATIALRCAPKGQYFKLYEKYLRQQAKWVSQEVRHDPIYKIVAEAGVTRQQYDACRQKRDLIDGLKWVKERGRTLGVIGTPNFFVNGKLVKSVLTMKEIREMVDPIIAGRVAGNSSVPVR